MQKWFFKVLVCSVNVFVLAYILPGIAIVDFFTAIIVALGLFPFVINAAIILLDAYFVHGFKLDSFWYALLLSAVLSFFNSLVHKKAFPEDKQNVNQQQ